MSDIVDEVLEQPVDNAKIPLDEVVNTYITIRSDKDRRAREFQQKDQELKSELEQLEQVMLHSCNEVNADSIKTSRGTNSVYTKQTLKSFYLVVQKKDYLQELVP
jgi:exonuclease VII large subunit